jgi:hypothetical protein
VSAKELELCARKVKLEDLVARFVDRLFVELGDSLAESNRKRIAVDPGLSKVDERDERG